MQQKFYDVVESNPVIAAVKDMEGLKLCCKLEDIKVMFILFGDVCIISDIVKRVKDAGKLAIVHVDLIGGLNTKEVVIDFIHANAHADGIITTKPALVRRAKELGMMTVLRYFLIDSMALESIRSTASGANPDFIEVLPGAMPKIIQKICHMTRIPVIAGGLITDKESVMAALSAGAISVSSTNHEVWNM